MAPISEADCWQEFRRWFIKSNIIIVPKRRKPFRALNRQLNVNCLLPTDKFEMLKHCRLLQKYIRKKNILKTRLSSRPCHRFHLHQSNLWRVRSGLTTNLHLFAAVRDKKSLSFADCYCRRPVFFWC